MNPEHGHTAWCTRGQYETIRRKEEPLDNRTGDQAKDQALTVPFRPSLTLISLKQGSLRENYPCKPEHKGETEELTGKAYTSKLDRKDQARNSTDWAYALNEGHKHHTKDFTNRAYARKRLVMVMTLYFQLFTALGYTRNITHKSKGINRFNEGFGSTSWRARQEEMREEAKESFSSPFQARHQVHKASR